MKALAISIEGFGSGMVGAYGSATFVTPAFDRLASRSSLLDQCIVDAPDAQSQLISLWTATHAAVRAAAAQPNLPEWSLWRALDSRNVLSHLITDSHEAAELAERMGCPRITLIEPDLNEQPTDDVEACGLMTVFAAAMETLGAPDAEGLIWIHARGLTLPWDAPLELRRTFMDPEDPDPPSDACVPGIEIDESTDPDLAIGWGQVAAAQVAVLDEALDALEQTISARDDADEWGLLVVGLGGIPLGEHDQIGRVHESLTTEAHHAPAIITRPHAAEIGSRHAELCQLPDLAPSLLDALFGPELLPELQAPDAWGRSMLDSSAPSSPASWPAEHTIAWFRGTSGYCLRTPAWELIVRNQDDGSEPRLELYVKPDDRWEANDVVSRRGDIAAKLLAILESLPELTAAKGRAALPALESDLTDLIR